MAHGGNQELYTVAYADSITRQQRVIAVHRPTKFICQTPSWTEFLICPICTNEFAAGLRVPITLRCGHSICKKCLSTIQQCPYDQSTIAQGWHHLPINFALLQLTSSTGTSNEILPSLVHSLSADDFQCYKTAKGCIEELALYLKPNGNSVAGLLSRPIQRKLVTLINCQLVEEEGRARSLRAARGLGERTVTELTLQHQSPQQLSANLWAAVHTRGCHFLGPAMQEEVLKLVLLAFADGIPLCRKVLVMFVVDHLESKFPQASKTSVGHAIQLLYRAGCFILSQRDGDSPLMELKIELRSYKILRQEHDAQIIRIATEAGLRIGPDQLSVLLYGDLDHQSDMQSLIDKQQSPQSFMQSTQELMIALQRTNDPANLLELREHLSNLAAIDASPDSGITPTWKECSDAVEAVKHVVNGLVDFMQNHGSRKSQESGRLLRYKISSCRDLSTRGNCSRGSKCTFAHNDEELEQYLAKFKKHATRQPIRHQSGPNQPVKQSFNGRDSNYPMKTSPPPMNQAPKAYHQNYQPPPVSSYMGNSPEYKQQSFHNQMPNISASRFMKYFQLPMSRSRNGDGNKCSTNWRSGNANVDNMKSVNNSQSHLMLPIKPQSAFQFNTPQTNNNFTRSDSILTSNTDDDFSSDNFSMSGDKYWNGLHSALPKRSDHSSFNNGSSVDANSLMNSRMNMNSNESSNRQFKPNFLNIPFDASGLNAQAVTSTPRAPPGRQRRSFWNESALNWSDGSQNFDESLGLCIENLWKLMEE